MSDDHKPTTTPEIIHREWDDPIPFIPDGVQRFYKFPDVPVFSVIDEACYDADLLWPREEKSGE